MTKVFLGILIFLIAFAPMRNSRLSTLAWAQTTQTLTLISGDGPIGTQDPNNKFTLDGGGTFQNSFIITPRPFYAVIPGTQYINRNPDFSGPEFTATLYKTVFVLPIDFSDPSLTIELHSDNVATLFLNGVQIGQQPNAEIFSNFQDPPESFMVNDPSLFRDGVNTLEFDIFNFTGTTAFNYKAQVSFAAPPANCPYDVLISNYQTTGSQFVEVANVGSAPISLDACSLVTFNVLTENSIGDATTALSGTLNPGQTTRVPFTGELPAGPGAIGIYDVMPPPHDGTLFSTDHEITGITYLSNTEVVGTVGHVTVSAHNDVIDCIYGGHDNGPFSRPFTPLSECVDVGVRCPCEGMRHLAVTWDDTFPTEDCTARAVLFSVDAIIGLEEKRFRLLADNRPGLPRDCAIIELSEDPESGSMLDVLITNEEFEACVDSLSQIAANDGVTCP